MGSRKATFQQTKTNSKQTNTVKRDNSLCIANSGPGRATKDQAWFLPALGCRAASQSSALACPSRAGQRGFLLTGNFQRSAVPGPLQVMNPCYLLACLPHRILMNHCYKKKPCQRWLRQPSYSTERKRKDGGVEGEDTGEGGEHETFKFKSLFCMRKHRRLEDCW